MSQAGVQYLMQLILNDEKFRARFVSDRQTEMKGVDLTDDERAALLNMDVDAVVKASTDLKNSLPKALAGGSAAIGSLYI